MTNFRKGSKEVELLNGNQFTFRIHSKENCSFTQLIVNIAI